ncbi:hypothetical protein LCGC14_0642160 [marine sediment metagenome]|uniref:Uncharacterized protein n=1 Tax=marine sediment metagenome TaxID=412755 RepID=A0A0F9R3Z5_9ZZZZ
MDCKHEKIDTWVCIDEKVYYECHECKEDIPREDVIILTKAQHQLMQDMAKAGREFRLLEIGKGDAWDTDAIKSMGEDATQVDKARLKLDKALDALDKGNNERGL